MRKLVLALGLMVAVFVLMSVNAGRLGSNDVFRIMAPDEQVGLNIVNDDGANGEFDSMEKADDYFDSWNYDASIVEGGFEAIEDTRKYDSKVYASIISYDLERPQYIAEALTKLAATQDVSTVVILGENSSLRGRYNVAVSKYGYETPFGKLEPNVELIDEMLSEFDGVGTSYRAFYQEDSVGNIAPFIKKAFPESRIVPLLLKDIAKDEYLDAMAEYLASIDDDIVVLVPMQFTRGMTKRTADFHDELSNTVIENFDKGGLDQIDAESKANLNVAFGYLEEVGAMEAVTNRRVNDNGNSDLFVTFHEGEIDKDRELTVLAFGDMMLGRHVRVMMDNYGNEYIFDGIKGQDGDFLGGADVVFGNLEGPIKGAGKKGGTSMNFAFNEDVAPLLKWNGFNLLSLSNNHATDQGWDGRDTTISALEAQGLGWCGHPSEADPESVYYNEVDGKTFAFVCLHDVTYRLDDSAAVQLIKDIRPNVDYLFVTIHWGVEYQHRPNNNLQIEPAHAFIDAGADFIIGHHPHVVQSFEIYKDKMIFYSLGNFVFDQYWSKATQEELAIGIVLDDGVDGGKLKTKVYLFPMRSIQAQSRLMTGEEYGRWIEEFVGYGDYTDEMKDQIRSGVIEW